MTVLRAELGARNGELVQDSSGDLRELDVTTLGTDIQ